MFQARDVMLLLDEIPIALGRTGYALEQYGIESDMLCLDKGLGSGIFPKAAIVLRDACNSEIFHCDILRKGKVRWGATAGLATLEIIR